MNRIFTFFLLLYSLCLPCFGDEAQSTDELLHDPSSELIQEKQKQIDAYRSLNAVNPLSEDYGQKSTQESAINSPLLTHIAQFQKLLSNPAFKKFMNQLSSPQMSSAAIKLTQHPNLKYLGYWELGWFIFFIFFRAWRSSKLTQGNWIKSIWMKVWTSILYFSVSSFIIPFLVLGEPYQEVLTLFIHAL